jgi:hypothetical protein
VRWARHGAPMSCQYQGFPITNSRALRQPRGERGAAGERSPDDHLQDRLHPARSDKLGPRPALCWPRRPSRTSTPTSPVQWAGSAPDTRRCLRAPSPASPPEPDQRRCAFDGGRRRGRPPPAPSRRHDIVGSRRSLRYGPSWLAYVSIFSNASRLRPEDLRRLRLPRAPRDPPPRRGRQGRLRQHRVPGIGQCVAKLFA